MGIKFNCPHGHKLNVKSFLAGRRGICPHCDARFRIPMESGGTAELIVKGDRSKGEATRLTAAMQDGPETGTTATITAESTYASTSVESPQGFGGAGGYASSPVSDPISEAPHAVWYVRPRSGGQYGPAAGDILREWISEGRVAGDSLVWCEGWPDWRQASSVFPQLAGAVSFPTTAPVSNAYPTNPATVSGGAMPVGSVAAAPANGAIPMGTAAPSAGASYTADQMGSTPTGSPVGSPANRAKVRRKSGSNTTLIVVLLIFVALILMGVFAWILFGQPAASTAWHSFGQIQALWVQNPASVS